LSIRQDIREYAAMPFLIYDVHVMCISGDGGDGKRRLEGARIFT
jgi:hypothetical protein